MNGLFFPVIDRIVPLPLFLPGEDGPRSGGGSAASSLFFSEKHARNAAVMSASRARNLFRPSEEGNADSLITCSWRLPPLLPPSVVG